MNEHTPLITSRDRFRSILDDLAAKAKTTLPENAGRIDAAVALVLAGDVVLHADGTALVGSARTPMTTYTVNGQCACPDYVRAPQGWCKHRISRALAIRAERLTQGPPPALADEDPAWSTLATSRSEIPASEPHADDEKAERRETASIETSETDRGNVGLPDALKPHIVFLHGKPFVLYAGLLALAHEHGLVSLKAKFISVTPELALAEAEAVFADGKTFAECADATPQNVGATIRAHYARMALTRSKARCLRDALNVGVCTLEELGESD